MSDIERVGGAIWQDDETHLFAHDFAERIQVSMQARGMTKQDLAAAVGISYQHVTGWAAGRRLPALPILPRISRALDVDAHWLMGLTRTSETLGNTEHPLSLPGPDASAEELEEAGEALMDLARIYWRTAHARRLARQMDLR